MLLWVRPIGLCRPHWLPRSESAGCSVTPALSHPVTPVIRQGRCACISSGPYRAGRASDARAPRGPVTPEAPVAPVSCSHRLRWTGHTSNSVARLALRPVHSTAGDSVTPFTRRQPSVTLKVSNSPSDRYRTRLVTRGESNRNPVGSAALLPATLSVAVSPRAGCLAALQQSPHSVCRPR